MQIARRDRMRGAEVIHAIKCLNEVKSCYVMSGSNNDLFVEIEAENSVRINEICEEFWKLQGVKDTQTSFVLSVHKRGG